MSGSTKMMLTQSGVLELGVIGLFFFLLVKTLFFTKSIGPNDCHACGKKSKAMLDEKFSKEDILQNMLFQVDKNSPYPKEKQGHLNQDSLLKLSSIITYFTTRANLPKQKKDRETRRAFLYKKDFEGYKKAIKERETEKEALS